MPFRQAHDFIGQVLREAERQEKSWVNFLSSDFRKISPQFGEDFLQSLSVDAAIASKSVPGGTAETSVLAAIAQLGTKSRTTGETTMSLGSVVYIVETASYHAEDRRSLP